MAVGNAKSILKPIADEIVNRVGPAVGDDSWNEDAHVEITLTAGECREVLKAVGLFKPQPNSLGVKDNE